MIKYIAIFEVNGRTHACVVRVAFGERGFVDNEDFVFEGDVLRRVAETLGQKDVTAVVLICGNQPTAVFRTHSSHGVHPIDQSFIDEIEQEIRERRKL